MFRIQFGDHETKRRSSLGKETVIVRNLAKLFRRIQDIIDLECESDSLEIVTLLCPITRDQERLMTPVIFSHSQVKHRAKSVHIYLKTAKGSSIYVDEIDNNNAAIRIIFHLERGVEIGRLSGYVEKVNDGDS